MFSVKTLNPYLKLERSQQEVSAANEQNDLLAAAIDASLIGVSIADARDPMQPLTYINTAFENMTGFTGNDVLGMNCRFLCGPETDPKHNEKIATALAHGAEVRLEILNYRKDRSTFWNQLQI